MPNMCLFKVEDTFQIGGRGLILAPGFHPQELVERRVKVGSSLELHRPDGTVTKTLVAGIEMLCPYDPGRPVPILLPKELAKADVPIGTEVWMVD